MSKDYKYYLFARLAPATITSIPLIILYNYTVGDKLSEAMKNIQYLPNIVNSAFSAGIIFLLVQLYRFISKEIFQRLYFKDEINMPTTKYLLYGDSYFTHEQKEKIREKIFLDFRISLPSIIEEQNNEDSARKRIITAVSQIRKRLKDNLMLFRHNIEYGFVRNGLGGCFFAVLVCLINIVVFKYFYLNELVFKLSSLFLLMYLIPIVFSKLLINRFGSYYAKILYEQYLGE